MKAFYEGDRRGQLLTIGVFAAVLVMVVLGIALKSPLIGLAAVLGACGSVIWLARRRSCADRHDEHRPTGSDRAQQ
jgi:Flp pilus assembly protein TadB